MKLQDQILQFTVKSSAPGKTILSGEHSVVYGKNALVIALNLRTETTTRFLPQENVELLALDFNSYENYSFTLKLEEFKVYSIYFIEQYEIQYCYIDFIKKFAVEEKNIQSIVIFIIFTLLQSLVSLESKSQAQEKKSTINLSECVNKLLSTLKQQYISISVKSDIPISKGLGSSASFLVSLTSSLTILMIKLLNIQQQLLKEKILLEKFINDNSYFFEKIYHGNPSGIDNTVSCFGGIILYNNSNPEKFKKLEKINFNYKILLIDSMVEKNTKRAVETVKKIIDIPDLHTIGQSSINNIGEITNNIIQLLKNTNISQKQFDDYFSQYIEINQNLLKNFQLSNYTIDLICCIAKKYDIPCKITGAGQGGFCIAFLKQTLDKNIESQFKEELKNSKFQLLDIDFSQLGVIYNIEQ